MSARIGLRLAAFLVLVLSLGACDDAVRELNPSESTGPAALPNLVGKGLQVAQDRAQAAGFRKLTSHDALGRGRHQIVDRDWKVCTQAPGPGRRDTGTEVDFGTVKLEEQCPAKDLGAEDPPAAGATMPNLVGKSLLVASKALGGNASVDVDDVSGKGRKVLVPSNWQVCTQQPRAGQPYDGVPVRLGVVKFGESC